MHVVLALAELGDGRVERRLLDVPEHDAHAGAGEALCERFAQAACATRDHRHPLLELTHCCPSCGAMGILPPLAGRPRIERASHLSKRELAHTTR